MFCTFPKVTLRECGQLAIRKDKNKNIDIKSIDQNWNLEMTGLCWIMFQVRVWNNIGRLEICLTLKQRLLWTSLNLNVYKCYTQTEYSLWLTNFYISSMTFTFGKESCLQYKATFESQCQFVQTLVPVGMLVFFESRDRQGAMNYICPIWTLNSGQVQAFQNLVCLAPS